MDKLKMHSPSKVDENIEKIGKLFPNCLTERIVGYKDEVRPDGSREPIMERAIDFDMLRQELSSVIAEGNEERYQFTWPDKKKSILLANSPIAATLRPCREESVDFDNTENLYIEGDNLDVLKLLQETYLGKIKMIYIDPPYNTGSDFVYEDDFAESADEYLANSGQFDAEGNRLVQNTESNGRFHTDWLNMILPRLKLAKDFLADDGVIFISIDDHELENLKRVCNEVFGQQNFIATIIWRKNYSPKSSAQFFSVDHDYILIYVNSVLTWHPNLLPRTEKQNAAYSNPDNDPRGPWKPKDLSARNYYSKGTYSIKCPSGRVIDGPPPGNYWRYSEEKFWEMDKEGRIWWGKDGNNVPAPKTYLSEVKQGIVPQTFWSYEEVGHTQDAKKELISLVQFPSSDEVFDTPKPIKLIMKMLRIATNSNTEDIILDFFSGSATTGHAVMELNKEDGGNRKYILVQLPAPMESQKFSSLADIGKERLTSAGSRIKEESPLTTANLDIGFRVLKLDSSNMKDVYYSPSEYEQSALDGLADNIKEGRTPEDLLFQVMLDLGILLSSKIEESEIAGKKVFSVADGFLIACFDADITDEVITESAKQKPYYFVMRDNSMASDSVATNFDQIFATYSPDTVRKVL